MITELFSALSKAMEGATPVALGACFLWGICSVLLSPCHLASIPLIVAFVDKHVRTSAARAFTVSLAFALGILVSISAIGTATATLGRVAGDLGGWTNYVVAVIFFIVGLRLADVIDLPWSGLAPASVKSKGMPAAFLMGLMFGIALGPCTFTFMAPMLGVTFKVAATLPGYAAMLLAAYALGHCSVIVLAGTSTEMVQKYLNWNQTSRGAIILRRTCGVLIILGGLYMLYTAR